MSVPAPPEPLLALPEVARVLGVSLRTLRRLIGRGELRAVAVGPRRRLIEPGELHRFIDAHRVLSDDDPAGSGSTVLPSDGGAAGHEPG